MDRMRKALPPYYHTSQTMGRLLDAEEAALSLLEERLEEVGRQFHVVTASSSLARWESEFGLLPGPEDTIELRRSRIMARMRGRGTVTVAQIQAVAEGFVGAAVEVVEHPGEYRFTLRVVGRKGEPENLEGLRAALEDCKPAHLCYDFQFTYNTWGWARRYRWGEAGETWKGIQVRDEWS